MRSLLQDHFVKKLCFLLSFIDNSFCGKPAISYIREIKLINKKNEQKDEIVDQERFGDYCRSGCAIVYGNIEHPFHCWLFILDIADCIWPYVARKPVNTSPLKIYYSF